MRRTRVDERRGGAAASLTACLAVLAATAGGGCGPAGTDAAPCTFELEWGRFAGGVFVPYTTGETAEITIGFQGFRFIYSAVRIRGVSASLATFMFDVTVDGHPTYFQDVGASDVFAGPDGEQYADEVLVFFNDIPQAELLTRNAVIVAYGAANGCAGRDEVSVILVDNDTCIAPPDGGNQCSDAGM
jgi:hypothetical protein